MKYQLLILLISISLLSSCKKNEIQTPETASLTVFNAVVGSAFIVRYGASPQFVTSNSSSQYALTAGTNDLNFWPLGDSIHPYYFQKGFTIAAREIYSLFLCGTPSAPEGVIQKENFPAIKDSVFGLRFINLSPNSTPLNITLSTSTGVVEFSNIAYKQITDFKFYPSLYNSSYTWQVRAANNPNVVLATNTYSATATLPRFTYRTFVIRGLVGSSPAIGITSITHGN